MEDDTIEHLRQKLKETAQERDELMARLGAVEVALSELRKWADEIKSRPEGSQAPRAPCHGMEGLDGNENSV